MSKEQSMLLSANGFANHSSPPTNEQQEFGNWAGPAFGMLMILVMAANRWETIRYFFERLEI